VISVWYCYSKSGVAAYASSGYYRISSNELITAFKFKNGDQSSVSMGIESCPVFGWMLR